MALLQLTNIEKILGDRMIFKDLSFTIDRGERVGLIGDNGAGKTTLFKLITNALQPDTGERSIARGTTIGMLDQDPKFDHSNTLIDEAELAFKDLHDLAHDLRDLEHKMGEVEGDELDKVLSKYTDLQHKFEEAGGYAWRHKLEATLHGVGFEDKDFEKPVSALSGGQRSRLALAKLLINPPDLLLLDEPTNHLDIAGVEWLEEYLLGYSGAVLVISHDRRLLDKVTNRIVWLTARKLRSYPGNYSAFQAQREVEVLSQGRAHEEQQAAIEKEKEYIRRFGAGQRARQAAGRKKRLERLLGSDQIVEKVSHSKGMHLKFGTEARVGDRLLRVEHLTMSFDGKQVWKEVQFDFKRGERVGVIGPNGSGKTTLLRVLVGELDADDGEIRWGANVSIGYYDQKLDDFDPELSVLDEVLSGVEGYNDRQLRDALGTMLFSGDDVEKQMKLLSGGERARVALTKLLLQKPNVLLLDEPTNHLDIAAAEALENALRNFDGSLLIVSHDREFLAKATKRLLVIEPPSVRDFDGNYDEWVRKQREAKLAAQEKKQAGKSQAATKAPPKPAPPPPKPAPAKPSAKKDNPYARKFGRLTVNELESQIAETEAALGAAQTRLSDSAALRDPGKLKQIQKEVQTLSQKLKDLEEEYFARGEG